MTKKQTPHVVVSAIWSPKLPSKPQYHICHFVMARNADDASAKVQKTLPDNRKIWIVRGTERRYTDKIQSKIDWCFAMNGITFNAGNRLLNTSQATAVYDAMCALNNVSATMRRIDFQTDRLEVHIEKDNTMIIVDRKTPLHNSEVYKTQDEFAAAYKLN